MTDNRPGAGLDSRRMKDLGGTDPANHTAVLDPPGLRIDGVPSLMGDDMVGTHEGSAVKTYMPMKVVEDEVSGEEDPRTPPERIRNPGIQVIIGRWRRIVSYHRGAVVVIVIVDHLGPRTRDRTFDRRFPLPARRLFRRGGANRFPDHLNSIPVFFGDGFVLIGKMNHPVPVGVFIDDRAGRSGSSGPRSL